MIKVGETSSLLTNILGVDRSEDPATAVEVDQSWPATDRCLALRSEASDLDVWSLALFPLDGKVLGLADGDQRSCAGDEDAAGS